MRLNRAWLMLALLVSGNALALGLGEIRLSSALNEPLRARIELLSATPEELESLKIQLASADTFSRYGIDRPPWLTRLRFDVVRSASGPVVEVRSQDPVTEPFVTFLIEATWPSGRLLREYTVLLDPPTFAPPPAAGAREAVTAPSRAEPADAGRIERPAPGQPEPAPAAREPASGTAPFDATAGSEVEVRRGDTLWGIARLVSRDDRLSMNQTMLAIYRANPEAFAGNINRLRAGSRLNIPGVDDIFRISRADAMSEVLRHNEAFGIAGPAPRTQPSLTLVPPDGEQDDYAGGVPGRQPRQPATTGQQAALEARIRELEDTVAEQQSLLEIRDNELARLREELARIRAAAGAEAPAAAEQPAVPEDGAPGDVFVDDTDQATPEEEAAAEAEEPVPGAPGAEAPVSEAPGAEQPAPAGQPAPTVVRSTPPEPGLVDRALGLLLSFWGLIGLALLLVIVVLLWFAKRAAGREDETTGVWEALDADEDEDVESRASTERLRALARDDDSSIVVIEQDRAASRRRKAQEAAEGEGFQEVDDETAQTGAVPAFEDTFSSDTAVNLDQSDPIAEADFHMAYGLYDQAAELVSGALAVEPERQDLMAKLCEIYFVWGNRDAFVDAASHLHDQLGGESTPDWDKIVIMGQQIAPDHRLFAGVSAAGATRAVDLSFDDSGDSNILDMDFDAGPDGSVGDVIDLGAEAAEEEDTRADQSGLDFVFDDEEEAASEPFTSTGATTTRAIPERVHEEDASTVESPTLESRASEPTVETPTLERSLERSMERPLEGIDGTSELPAFSERDTGQGADATAEIDLDDLGLDLDDLAKTGFEDDVESGLGDDIDFGLSDLDSELGAALDAEGEETGESRPFSSGELSSDARTGRNRSLKEELDLDSTTEIPFAGEETGRRRTVEQDDTDVEFDSSLLEASGNTQVLKGNFGSDDDTEVDAEDSSDTGAFPSAVDFDFSETEALPKERYESLSTDKTGEMPKPGEADDLDDLAAALRLSEGDTVRQRRDEETVEQPTRRGRRYGGDGEDEYTEALSPDELSDELHEARTMTEVGTKLDLARAYVDMGDPDGARSILEEVLDEGDEGQRQQAQRLIESLPA